MFEADAVVFAVGIGAMQKLVTANPALAAQNDFRNVMNLKVRLQSCEKTRRFLGTILDVWRI